MSYKRISRVQHYVDVLTSTRKRSTCNRNQVGAIAVRDGRIIAEGYNGSPKNTPHCIDDGCNIVNGGCIRTVHAEANLISYCARKGIALEGSTLYITTSPCYPCAQLIINCGFKEVVYLERYRKTEGIELIETVMFISQLGRP